MIDLSRKIQTTAALVAAWLAFASPAGAQMSEADLVVRIERLENQIRQLTGRRALHLAEVVAAALRP